MSPVTWYSLDRDQKVHDHHPVDLEAALLLLGRHVSDAGFSSSETFEEYVSASTFGLSRDEHNFLELSIITPSQVFVQVQLTTPGVPPLLRLWFGLFEREDLLSPASAAAERIRQFYTLPPDELRSELKRRPPS